MDCDMAQDSETRDGRLVTKGMFAARQLQPWPSIEFLEEPAIDWRTQTRIGDGSNETVDGVSFKLWNE